jgi:hypothetical protein
MTLAYEISEARSVIDNTLAQKGEGHDGYRVADFNVDQSVTDALKTFGAATPANNQQVTQAQAFTYNGQTYTLKNPYTHASQEFLRHHLLNDFEGTMTRQENAETSARSCAPL